MAERILFLPGFGRSPAAAEVLGGYRELLRELRGSFDVDIFSWPTTQPTPTAPPTWQGTAEALRSALTPGCHVVVVSGNVAIALMALDGDTSARTLVCDGLQASPTTLRSIGMGSLADAAEIAWLIDVRSFTQGSLAFSQGSTEDELEADRLAIGDNYGSPYLTEFVRSFMDLDLGKEKPRILVPTLYFEPDADMPGFSGMQDYFLSLVPQAETDYVEGWPRRQGDGDVGAELGRRIVAFLKKAPRATTLATVLLTDIVGSTARAVELGDRRWSELLEEHRAAIREQLSRHSGREVDTVGDGFLAAFDSPARGVACSLAIIEAVKRVGLDLRAGLHTGECETSEGKLTGLAVHIAARVSQEARTGEVLVSETVRQLLAGSGITFEDRGARALKGVEGEWRLYRALPA